MGLSFNSRSGTEGALVCILANGRKRVCDNRHEQVDKPEVEHDDAYDEEKARDEEL